MNELLQANTEGIALIYRNSHGNYDNTDLLKWQPSKPAWGLARNTKFSMLVDGIVRKAFLVDMDKKLQGLYWVEDPDVFRDEVQINEICKLSYPRTLRTSGGPSGRHLTQQEFKQIIECQSHE